MVRGWFVTKRGRPGVLRRERPIVGEIGRGVAEFLADECVLDLAVGERDARVEEIIVRP